MKPSDSEVDRDHLHPPLKMLQTVSHWVETYPSFLFPGQLLDQHSTPKLPLINSSSNFQSLDFYSSRSPLVGLIQWCVITPLTSSLDLYGQQKLHKDNLKSPALKSPEAFTDLVNVNSQREPSNKSSKAATTKDVSMLVADLHANLLSLLLSGSQQPPPLQLTGMHGQLITGNDMRDIVSALTGFKQKLSSLELPRTATSSIGSLLEESVERLAQFVQILLFTGLLSMKQGTCMMLWTCMCTQKFKRLIFQNQSQPRGSLIDCVVINQFCPALVYTSGYC